MTSKVLSVGQLKRFVVQLICRPPTKVAARTFNVLTITSRPVLTKLYVPNLQTNRYKSKKKKGKVDDDSSDDEEKEVQQDVEDDIEDIPGVKVVTYKVPSGRLDKVLNGAFSKPVVEEAFLKGNIRRNDEKVLKKAIEVFQSDVLDIVLGPDETNQSFLRVSRLEIMDIQYGRYAIVKARISKNILIKPYDSVPS